MYWLSWKYKKKNQSIECIIQSACLASLSPSTHFQYDLDQRKTKSSTAQLFSGQRWNAVAAAARGNSWVQMHLTDWIGVLSYSCECGSEEFHSWEGGGAKRWIKVDLECFYFPLWVFLFNTFYWMRYVKNWREDHYGIDCRLDRKEIRRPIHWSLHLTRVTNCTPGAEY